TMRITGHPEKRLKSESWSSLSRRILGDNISNSKTEHCVSGDSKQQNDNYQASGNATRKCQLWKLIISHGSITDEAKPQACEREQQGEQGVVMERVVNIKMQERVQRAGATATRTKPVSRKIEWASRVKGILRRRKAIYNGQTAK